MILTIHITRKPVIGSVASNVLKWSTGGINIDECRVSTSENLSGGAYAKNPTHRAGKDMWTSDRKGDTNCFKRGGAGDYEQPTGRFPANLILSHQSECKQVGTRTVKGNRTDTRPDGDAGREDKTQWRFRPTDATKRGYGATESVADWSCTEGCPIRELDHQSGERPSGGSSTTNPRQRGLYEDGLSERIITPRTDTGTASRFFKQIQEEGDIKNEQ